MQTFVEYIKAKRHEACLMLPLTGTISEQLLRFGLVIPDDELAASGRADFPHVTVKYGMTASSMPAIIRIIEDTPPIEVRLGISSLFQNDTDVVKLDVHSDGLYAMHQRICSELDWAPGNYLEYIPHATIAYVKHGCGQRYADVRIFDGCKQLVTSCALADATGAMREIQFKRPTSS